MKNKTFDLVPVDFNPFSDGEIEKTVFLTESQQEIWTACIIGGEEANCAYNESVSLNLKGQLMEDIMKQALRAIPARHEALRATISADGDYLCVYKNKGIDITVLDISSSPAVEQQQFLHDHGQKDALTPFDLQNGPLFRVSLIKCSGQLHIVRLTAHHIICDGWSFGIILEDLGKLYNAYAKGEYPLLEDAIGFSQYAIENRSFSSSDLFKETEAYWLRQYEGPIPELAVPTDRPRTATRTYKSRRDDFILDQDLVAQIKKTGGKVGASLVTTLIASFEIYLQHITGRPDVILGLPAAGQSVTGMNCLVGHCVNLLPLRSQPKADLPFIEYLKLRKSQILEDYDHQQVTFGSLLKKLNFARDSSRVPLVPVIFNVDAGMDANVSFYRLEHQLVSNPREYENFEIFLNVTGSQHSMVLEWSYNTQLFDKETIETMMKGFEDLLKEATTNPNLTIRELFAHTKPVAEKIESASFSSDKLITELIHSSVLLHAAKTALYFNETTYTYSEIDHLANQVAHYLLQQGVKKGEIVGIALDRSAEMIITILATLKSGAAYLPIDPSLPEERIAYMLADSQSKRLITSSAFSSHLYEGILAYHVEQIWPQLSSFPTGDPQISLSGNDLAYVLYTSGSTGRPKGVLIGHKSLSNLLLSLQQKPGLGITDNMLAITTISFDIAAVELFLPLTCGASIVLADGTTVKDGRALLSLIEEKNVTVVQATPTTWRMLEAAGLAAKHRLTAFCGGEQFPKDLADSLLEKCRAVWNMYGPTETTIYSIIKELHASDQLVTIGYPIANTQLFLLDENQQPVPYGNTGEICIGGAGLSLGYLNQPALTREKFIDHPISKIPGDKLYRTGDLGKLVGDGDMLCLGRIDQQIKIRGYRIEPQEIEHHLVSQSGINDAVIVAQENNLGEKQLAAYVVLDQNDGSGWQERWEDLYTLGAKEEEDLPLEEQNLDIAIISQYNTEEDIREHGIEWTNEGLKRIKALNAANILELGTGGGHLLLALAPQADSYIATDYSSVAINKLNEKLALHPEKWEHVKAYEASATDFNGIEEHSLDLVFLHGVIQYFPSLQYVLQVVEPAIKTLKDGGCLFIGDPQTLAGMSMHFYSDQLAITTDDVSVADFKKITDYRIRKEEEISIDPDFFYSLPAIFPDIKAVDVQIRGGNYSNEATKCHYDVWLYVGQSAPKTVKESLSIPFEAGASIAWIEQQLTASPNKPLRIFGIPNQRVFKDHALMQLIDTAKPEWTVKDLKEKLEGIEVSGLNPTLLWELGERLNYKAHIRWSTDGSDGKIEVVFIPLSFGNAVPEKPQEMKLDGQILPKMTNSDVTILPVPEHQVQQWKKSLAAKLPEYMVPDIYIALNKLPTTNSGKVDRNGLPKLEVISKDMMDPEFVSPSNETEELLEKIWSHYLNTEHVSVTSNFFELGGHSLIAVKMMLAIEKEIGIRLPITALFENSTIEKLAKLISPDASEQDDQAASSKSVDLSKKINWDSLVTIKASGTKIPIYMVHGAGLNALTFSPLGRYMDENQSVYALQAMGLDGTSKLYDTIEEIAAKYLEEVLANNPKGPYAIAGYSLGGLIAYEMAKQLLAMGKEIALLGILDTNAIDPSFAEKKLLRKLSKKFIRQFKKLRYFSASFMNDPKKVIHYQKTVLTWKLKEMFIKDYRVEDEFFSYSEKINKSYDTAYRNYVMTPVPVKVDLFRVMERVYYLDDPNLLGWGEFALKGVDVHQVPGDHKSFLFPPYDKEFARILQNTLNKVN